MTEKAEKYLAKIREIYSRSHKTKLDTMMVSGEPDNDSVFLELERNGYVKFHPGVAPTIELLEKITRQD